MGKLIVNIENFSKVILGLIEAGVVFEAHDDGLGSIIVTFNGGF